MDLLVSSAAWWLPVVGLLFILRLTSKASVDWKWVVAAILVFGVYSAAVLYLPTIPGFPVVEGAAYNWTGKIAAILTTLAMIAIVMKASDAITAETLGLTIRQNQGSLRPAFIATAVMVGLVALLQMLGGSGPQTDPETLAYQATIPGLDEELMFRGLLLALLATALQQSQAAWKWAGVAVTIVFTFGHSFFYQSDGIQFDPIAMVYVAILGGLLIFIRLRTGSILIPILAHNLTNVVGKLV